MNYTLTSPLKVSSEYRQIGDTVSDKELSKADIKLFTKSGLLVAVKEPNKPKQSKQQPKQEPKK